MGIPLRRGRSFDRTDRGESRPVAIVNETMARQYWPGQDAIGKRFKIGDPDSKVPWVTIVGIVGRRPADGARRTGQGRDVPSLFAGQRPAVVRAARPRGEDERRADEPRACGQARDRGGRPRAGGLEHPDLRRHPRRGGRPTPARSHSPDGVRRTGAAPGVPRDLRHPVVLRGPAHARDRRAPRPGRERQRHPAARARSRNDPGPRRRRPRMRWAVWRSPVSCRACSSASARPIPRPSSLPPCCSRPWPCSPATCPRGARSRSIPRSRCGTSSPTQVVVRPSLTVAPARDSICANLDEGDCPARACE